MGERFFCISFSETKSGKRATHSEPGLSRDLSFKCFFCEQEPRKMRGGHDESLFDRDLDFRPPVGFSSRKSSQEECFAPRERLISSLPYFMNSVKNVFLKARASKNARALRSVVVRPRSYSSPAGRFFEPQRFTERVLRTYSRWRSIDRPKFLARKTDRSAENKISVEQRLIVSTMHFPRLLLEEKTF